MAHKGWFVGTLDLRKAFDTASPQLVAQILHRIGMPQNVLGPILDVWSHQERWVQYMDVFFLSTKISPVVCHRVIVGQCLV